jgi:hypothetical protein
VSGFYPFGGVPVGGPAGSAPQQAVLDAFQAVETAMSQLTAAVNTLVSSPQADAL